MEKNEKLKVAFFIRQPLQYYIYEVLMHEMEKKGAEPVIILNDIHRENEMIKNMHMATKLFLNEKKVKYKCLDLSIALETKEYFGAVITTYYFQEMHQLARYHFKVSYGIAKILWATAPDNLFFEKTFSFGQYDHERINIFNSDIKVGNIRFDNWFQNLLPNKEEIKNKFELPYDKKVIVYLPTYAELSSIDKWASDLKTLKNDYHIITKVHHGTKYSPDEIDRLNIVKECSDYVLGDEYDTLELLKLADFVLADNSGVIFDSILADKNTILLNNDSNINESMFSNEDSIEQTIRKDIKSVSSLTELKEVLDDEGLFLQQKEIREKINNEIHSHRDGLSSKRVADIIYPYLTNEHKIERNYYKEQIIQQILSLQQANNQYLLYIEKLKQLVNKLTN